MLGWGRSPVVEVVEAGGASESLPLGDDGTAEVGPLVVRCDAAGDGRRTRWSIEATRRCELDSVRLWVRRELPGDVAWFRNGWQSWSPFGVDRVGRADDPARAGAPWLVRAIYDGDAAVPPPGELRSWGVSALVGDVAEPGDGTLSIADVADRPATVLAFDGGTRHDGVLAVRRRGEAVECAAGAWLGGVVLDRGDGRELHDVVVADAERLDHGLAAWAELLAGPRAGRTAPPRAGWCSWYQYFHRVTEADVRANLSRASEDGWPFDVFQVDDGYQSAVGDWLTCADTFPAGHALAGDIAAAGFVPGLWTAPFLVVPRSRVATEHPAWLLGSGAADEPLLANVNLEWGGDVWALDTSREDVCAHLTDVTAELVARGWRYLKLDFLYAAALAGRATDRSLTPAERLRRGLEAIRRGAGPDVTLLGCGSPLVPAIGLVDAMRIGPDVAPRWDPDPDGLIFAGYEQCPPSLANASRACAHRAFLANRWWLDDPDCVLLRETDTQLTPAQIDAWARQVGALGGAVVVSDDLDLLGPAERSRFAAALAAGAPGEPVARR